MSAPAIKPKRPEPLGHGLAGAPVAPTSNCGKEPQSVRDAYDRMQGGKK